MRGAFGTQYQVDLPIFSDGQTAMIEVLCMGYRGHIVDQSWPTLLHGEGQQCAGPTVPAYAVREISANRGVQVNVVGIRLVGVDRIPQRSPIRMLRIRVKVYEIGIREIHH